MLGLRSSLIAVAATAGLVVTADGAKVCPPDSVRAGPTCVDKYEGSIWKIPATDAALIKKVEAGKAVLGDLLAGGATLVSPTPSCTPAFPASFDVTGNWTEPLYAVSLPAVAPTGCVTWFQAEQACALSGKRLLTNQEWQRAAAGTPDPGTDNGTTDCATNGGPVATGSRSACVSRWGVHDMVGNLDEWVADWGTFASDCPGWGTFSEDWMCLGGASSTVQGPGAMLRGGVWGDSVKAGVFAVFRNDLPTLVHPAVGFRCAR